MKAVLAVIDTNVVVSGLITKDSEAVTVRLIDKMLEARFRYLLSLALLTEYRSVLLRPRIKDFHKLREKEVDRILTEIAANAIMCDSSSALFSILERGDAHLWRILSAYPEAVLVTGDLALFKQAPRTGSVISPREFMEIYEPSTA